MQKIRGFIYFENKTLTDVKLTFGNFRFDQATFAYFTSLKKSGHTIDCPGVFITGKVNEKYSTVNVVYLLRKLMRLDEKIKHFDLSTENEDFIKAVIVGRIYGEYLSIRIESPCTKDKINTAAEEIARQTSAHDVWIREVGSGGGKPALCIDLINDEGFNKSKDEIEEIASELNFKTSDYTTINLYKAV